MFAGLDREPQDPGRAEPSNEPPNALPNGGAWRAQRCWRWGVPIVLLATVLRVAWVLAVPTVPVGDFATYRESANYLLEFGALDHGFIYMPGFVLMLAGVASVGGDLLAQKMIGALLGSLAAAAIFGITAKLADEDNAGVGVVGRRICPCATAVIATLLYALWPAGVALSSVVGTDVPAASLILIALWALVAWGDRRPVAAALGFGALMGLAAYVRAVALPLTLMSAGYWALRRGRPRWPAVAALTALATGATLIVLLPWGVRNWRQHGALSFSDDHGGITALIGANPNSEGTYTRALNTMFKDLTGRTVLTEPHRETDRLAFDLAKDWTRFEPAYAVGLGVLKAERLFWSEWHLLYWPIGRPGVLIGPPRRWFAAHAAAANAVADAFWYGLCGLFAAGIALAIADRRFRLLSLIPFQIALTATYTIFFAEPRYRVPIQMMAFPVAAFALARAWQLGRAIIYTRDARARALARLGLAGAAAIALFVGASWLTDAGAELRATHRWAATVWTIDGKPGLAKWRRHGPARGPSPVAGAPNGVRLTTGDDGRATAEIVLDRLPAGTYQLGGELEGDGPRVAPTPGGTGTPTPTPTLRFELIDAADERTMLGVNVPPATGAERAGIPLRGGFVHPGGPLRLIARLEAAPPAAAGARSVWVSSIALTTARAAPAPAPTSPETSEHAH
jgi:hypothetical protein